MTKDEKIQELEAKLTERDAELAEYKLLLATALTKINQLEALVLSHVIKKTSKNSHLPPSADIALKNQSLREKSDKPVGGQGGHKGHTLKINTKPDVVIPLRPNFCDLCGQDLRDIAFDFLQSRQVIDIPPIVPVITEYQCFSTTCTCGHKVQGDFPEGVNSPIQYGPNVQRLAIYNSYYQFIPFQRLESFFRNVCNLPICKGTIENILRRNAKKAKPAYEAIKEEVEAAIYVGADETGYSLNGKKGWFWTWQNEKLTYIVATTSRSKTVIEEEFPNGLPNAILGSDRLAAQLSTISKGKQICLAHLLRDINYLIEAEKNTWSSDFKKLLQDAIILKQLQGKYEKNDVKSIEIEQRLDKLLSQEIYEQLLKEPEKHKKTITFFKGMTNLRYALFTFLYHKEVPFHNNGAERAFRMVKVKDKISGQFKSLQNEFAIFRSVFDTAVKNGQSVWEAILNIVNMPANSNYAG